MRRTGLAAMLAAALVYAGSALPCAADEYSDVLYAVTLNGRIVDASAYMIAGAEGTVYATAAQLAEWRLRVPGGSPVVRNGQQLYALSALSGSRVHVDPRALALDLRVAPGAFLPSNADADAAAPPPRSLSRGAYAAYDLAWHRDADHASADGTIDAGTSVGSGDLRTSFRAGTSSGPLTIQRTQTTWTRVDSRARTALRIGDDTTRVGSLGDSLPFFGVTFTSDERSNPNFIARQIFAFDGVAAAPSTVVFESHGTQLRSISVPEGPFEITAPATGDGIADLQIVVRDASGREFVVSRPFYGDSRLLRQGVSDFSLSAGTLRNVEESGDPYRGLLFSGDLRHGITNAFTAEGAVEAYARNVLVGGGAVFAMPHVGSIMADAGLSGAAGRRDVVGRFGYAFRGRTYGFDAVVDRERNPYATVGIGGDGINSDFGLGLSRDGRAGRFDLRYQATRVSGSARTASLTGAFLRRFGPSTLSLHATVGGNPSRAYSVGVSIARSLGHAAALTAGAGSDRGIAYQRARADGNGLSYDLQAGREGTTGADVTYRASAADVSLAVAHTASDTTFDAAVAGGIAFVGGRIVAARTVDQSFGLVKTGYAGLPVMVNDVEIGRTNRRGELFIPALSPFVKSVVSVDPSALPLGVALETARTVVAGRNSAHVITFATTAVGGVTLRAVDGRGQPLTVGTPLTAAGRAEPWYVADGGVVYVSSVRTGTLQLAGSVKGTPCTLTLEIPKDVSATPDLGAVPCR